jgi:hypothetical protein
MTKSKREKRLYEEECIHDYSEEICREFADRVDFSYEEEGEEE